MNSRTAHMIMKAENRSLKQRKKAWDASNSQQLTTLEKPLPTLSVKTTDYRAKPSLANMPLKLRERSRYTEWPVEQRPLLFSNLPEARNVGRAFRRYADGTLCYDDAVLKVKHVLQKYNDGAQLHEHEAVLLASVFPEVRYENLPKRIVDLKAPLTANERRIIKDRLPTEPKSIPTERRL